MYMFRATYVHRQEVKIVLTASGIITLSKNVVFIQLLRLCGVYLLYINC